ncbi:MAG: DUF503 domain-containing protein [Acidimicrobiales bacterium]
MHVLAAEIDLRVPGSRSLKDKRSALRPILDGLRHRHPVAAAEVDHLDEWQRARSVWPPCPDRPRTPNR